MGHRASGVAEAGIATQRRRNRIISIVEIGTIERVQVFRPTMAAIPQRLFTMN
jgi:hypothetical protein